VAQSGMMLAIVVKLIIILKYDKTGSDKGKNLYRFSNSYSKVAKKVSTGALSKQSFLHLQAAHCMIAFKSGSGRGHVR